MDVDIDKQLEEEVKEAEKKNKQDLEAKQKKEEEEKTKKELEKAARKKLPIIKRIFPKKLTSGPMGVTDIAKGKVKIVIDKKYSTLLFMTLECLIVGFLINIFAYCFGMSISIIHSLGWAVGVWLLKFKMPEIVKLYRK
jgi:hypothetical protein